MYNKPLTRGHPLYNGQFLFVLMVSTLERFHCMYIHCTYIVRSCDLAVVSHDLTIPSHDLAVLSHDLTSIISLQVRTHTHRQQLMDTVHSKTQPYPFDYFFEETEKKRNKKKASKQHHQEESSSDETDSDKDEP